MRLLAVAILLAALAAPVRADDTAALGKVADLTLKTLDGKEIKLADCRKTEKSDGKVVLIHFWSYKCPSGYRILDDLKSLAAECEKKGIVFIAVCAYGESEAELKAFVEKGRIAYPMCFDDGKKATKYLGAKVVTATYVLDREGKLVYRGAWGKAGAAASAANEGKDVPEKETKPEG